MGSLPRSPPCCSPARFGRLEYDQDLITGFKEKPHGEEGWINGGFFVLQREAIDYIASDETIWEREPIERLTQDHQLMGYRHYRFWSCMDTLREKNYLEELWQSSQGPLEDLVRSRAIGFSRHRRRRHRLEYCSRTSTHIPRCIGAST